MDAAAEIEGPALGCVAGATSSEQRLVARAQEGSAEAAEALVRTHWDQAYRAAFLIVGDRHLAEDIVQESFVRALASLGHFRREQRFAPWLKRIVANRSIDALRVSAREQRTLDAAGRELATRAAAEGPQLISDPELAGAIAALPEEQRMVVVLRYVLDLGPGHIAKALGISKGTVGSRLRRGLDAVKSSLEEGKSA